MAALILMINGQYQLVDIMIMIDIIMTILINGRYQLVLFQCDEATTQAVI